MSEQQNPLKIYLSTTSQRLPRAREAMDQIRAAGYEITHDWTKDCEGTPRPWVDGWADIHGAAQADVTIVLMLRPMDQQMIGSAVEMGVGLGVKDREWQTRVIVVEEEIPFDHFFGHVVNKFSTLDEALTSLAGTTGRESSPPKSPAYTLLAHVWEKTKQGSYRRLNGAMIRALSLAIFAQMTFDEEDFNRFFREFRAGYWLGAESERWYSSLCESGNISGCRAWEQYVNRPPYILNGQRLHVGSEIPPECLDGRLAKSESRRNHITSFAADGRELICCVTEMVKIDDAGHYEEKIRRRIYLTHDEIKEMESSRKARELAAMKAEPISFERWDLADSVEVGLRQAAKVEKGKLKSRSGKMIKDVVCDGYWLLWEEILSPGGLGEYEDLRDWFIGVVRRAAENSPAEDIPQAVADYLRDHSKEEIERIEEPHE